MAHSSIDFLTLVYQQMLKAADPLCTLAPYLPPVPAGKTAVIGIGKAAASMALAVEQHWQGPLEGVVVVPEGATLDLRYIQQHESAHPIPDHRSVLGAQKIIDAVSGLTADDLVIALISGGGSALCAYPMTGVSLSEKQAITRALLRSGASIHEINTVRKHLSLIKGGRLSAQTAPASLISLLISDIPGDDPRLIASAPTLGDASTCAQALDILNKYDIERSSLIEQGLRTGVFETPKSSDQDRYHIIASAHQGLEAAASFARSLGYEVRVLSDAIEGETKDIAGMHVAMAKYIQAHRPSGSPPCLLLSGGETTVTVRGSGLGGRNTEFVLAAALALKGQSGIQVFSAGTDGLDGSGKAAGAWADADLILSAQDQGMDARVFLDNNDSYSFFERMGTTVVTGPTYTNVNDFRAILIK